jgi:integrase
MDSTADTFRAVALDWIEASRHQWSTTHAAKILQRLERDAFPAIGARPLRDIDAEALRSTVAAIEARGASDASLRVFQMAAHVFRHGIATGRCDQDPTRDLRGTIKRRAPVQHAHVSPDDFPALLLAIARYDRTGERTTGLSLQLLVHTLVPVADLLGAVWDEFDTRAALWTIPASRAVSHQAHRVPLTPEVLAILAELRDLSTGGPFVVAGRHGAPLAHNTLLFALRRIDYGGRMTLAGFRTIAGTLLAADGFPADLVALQMAKHPRKAEPGSVDPSTRLAERVEMMRRWSARVATLTRQAHAAERAQAIP